ncbi:hypothetical protein Leryth_005010 [Lithospermum erythrorhizon]|nr:hypothetical protein Leryth_005010 [Lithospermum erythrorhizon]
MNSTDLNFQSQMHSPFMLKLTPMILSITRTAFNLFSAASSSTTTAAVSTFPAKPISESQPFKPPQKTKASIKIKNTKPSSALSCSTTTAVLNIPAKPILALEPTESPQKPKSSTRIKNISAASCFLPPPSSSAAAVLNIPVKAILAPEPIEVPTMTKSSIRVKTSKAVSEALLKGNWLDRSIDMVVVISAGV